jgi:hypothetical protein
MKDMVLIMFISLFNDAFSVSYTDYPFHTKVTTNIYTFRK